MKIENQLLMRYSFNKILLYDIVMARKSRKLSPFIKKVMAYYKAHKSEGISYGDAMKAVSKEMKKGGNSQEEREQEQSQQEQEQSQQEGGNQEEQENQEEQNQQEGGNQEEQEEQEQNQQGGKRRKRKASKKSAKKSKKGSKKTSRRTRKK